MEFIVAFRWVGVSLLCRSFVHDACCFGCGARGENQPRAAHSHCKPFPQDAVSTKFMMDHGLLWASCRPLHGH